MPKARIVKAGLALTVLLQAAACSHGLAVDPMTQTVGKPESKNCATEAKRMQWVAENLPNVNEFRQELASLHVWEAEQAAATGNEKGCWDALGLAQSYMN